MWGFTTKRSCSTGTHLPWGLIPVLALITGAGMLLLWMWAKFPSAFTL